MAMAIGYNVKNAREVANNIKRAYNDLGRYTESEWNNIVRTLQREWIGVDEQDFEKKLAERICTLYVDAHNVANGAINTISNLANAWITGMIAGSSVSDD